MIAWEVHLKTWSLSVCTNQGFYRNPWHCSSGSCEHTLFSFSAVNVHILNSFFIFLSERGVSNLWRTVFCTSNRSPRVLSLLTEHAESMQSNTTSDFSLMDRGEVGNSGRWCQETLARLHSLLFSGYARCLHLWVNHGCFSIYYSFLVIYGACSFFKCTSHPYSPGGLFLLFVLNSHNWELMISFALSKCDSLEIRALCKHISRGIHFLLEPGLVSLTRHLWRHKEMCLLEMQLFIIILWIIAHGSQIWLRKYKHKLTWLSGWEYLRFPKNPCAIAMGWLGYLLG